MSYVVIFALVVILKSAVCCKSQSVPVESFLIKVKAIKNTDMRLPESFEKKLYRVRICPCNFILDRNLLVKNYKRRKSRKSCSKRKIKLVSNSFRTIANKQSFEDEGSENSKEGLFDYLRNQQGEDFLEKLKTNLKQRGLEIYPENTYHSKEEKPEYDRKIDEKDSLLKYKKWQISSHPGNFQTESFYGDSSNLDVNEQTVGSKGTDDLKPVADTDNKTNDTAIDDMNRKIDKEILPALTAISNQLRELKENGKEKSKAENKSESGGKFESQKF